MRELAFLLTNDDGIESPLLAALAEALRPHGRVTIVAPTTERSWISKAISRHQRLTIRERGDLFAGPAWEVDGTPADCVNLALGHLVPGDIDMVVSGINMGSNASLPLILASGTVGGALEGALHGRHALASSIRLTKADFAQATSPGGGLPETMALAVRATAARTAAIAANIARGRRPRRFLVHNLNFPPATSAETPLERTVPALLHMGTLFNPAEDGERRIFGFTFAVGEELPQPLLTDRACLESGRASHSVLDFGRLGMSGGPFGSVSRVPRPTSAAAP